jgi:hypothetical protein
MATDTSSSLADAEMRTEPSFVSLTGLLTKLSRIWRSRLGVAADPRQRRGQHDALVEPLHQCLRRHIPANLLDDLSQIDAVRTRRDGEREDSRTDSDSAPEDDDHAR